MMFVTHGEVVTSITLAIIVPTVAIIAAIIIIRIRAGTV